MKYIRRVLSVILGFVAISVLLLTLPSIGSEEVLINQTLEHSRDIQKSFDSAVAYVEGYRKAHSSLPTPAEFQEWSDQFPEEQLFTPRGLMLELDVEHFPDEVIEKFGSAPAGSYLILCWRGEWTEYYSSWAKRSSIATTTDPKGYRLFGIPYAMTALMIGTGLLLAFSAFLVWPKQRVTRDSQP